MRVNEQWLEDHGLTQADIDEFRHPGPPVMGGTGSRGSGGSRSGRGGAAKQNPLIDAGIARFNEALLGPEGEGGVNQQFFDIGQTLVDRGLGTETDPLIEAQRERGLDASRAQLVRSGITGGAFQNQQARVSAGFDEAALNRRGEAQQGGLQLQQSALGNLLADPTLRTAQLAAENAGRGGGGGKK